MNPAEITNRGLFLALFPTTSAAIAFEEACLSIGHALDRKFLPPEALAVLDGGNITPAYWVWLATQHAKANGDVA